MAAPLASAESTGACAPELKDVTIIDQKQREAFNDYIAAKARADETSSFEDARAAGLAWRRFIDLYLPSDRRLGDAPARITPPSQHPEVRP